MLNQEFKDKGGDAFVKGAFYEDTDGMCGSPYRFYRATEVKADRISLARIADGRIIQQTNPQNCRKYAVQSRVAMQTHLEELEEVLGNIKRAIGKLHPSPSALR